MRVTVIVPALDEEDTIEQVVLGIPRDVAQQVVVVDNGSRDRTVLLARTAGASVVSEPERGYGVACQAGLRYAAAQASRPDVVVFMDGDGSNDPADLTGLLLPLQGDADLALGSRVDELQEPGSLTTPQRLGNRLATFLLRLRHGARFADLGPFRAARFAPLLALGLRDRGFGWNVEMQVRALRAGLRIVEVPVHSRRRRGGRSKISGTWTGTMRAGSRILYECLRSR